MTRRLSENSDALCHFCGNPAAEGLADAKGLWCANCGRIRAVLAFESAAFELLHTFPAEFDAVIDGVRAYDRTPDHLHSSHVASQWRPIKSARVWRTA